tara:strand:+ start:2987 stop:5332 length:2346 start_codon:yes stop_codon:yes gene_type:complete
MSREDLVEVQEQEDIEIEGPEGTTINENIDVIEDEEGNLLAGEEAPTAPQDNFYANLAEFLDDSQLKSLASKLLADFKDDSLARKSYIETYTKGLDLLGFKYQEVTRPFIGASGVTHPLLAEAATQFQAQAFKELLPSDGPVRCQVVGAESKETIQQANRVKDYMNYQITDVMEEYTPEMDQMLFFLPLAGSTFKKVYYDPAAQRCKATFIHAEDLVVPYNASDLYEAERISEVQRVTKNTVAKRIASGFYRDVELPEPFFNEDRAQKKYQELEGVTPQKYQDLYNFVEMHVDLDLPGYESDDGVKVPYIVTLDRDSMTIMSIYRNYKPDDQSRKRIPYFVHYKFLPGLGFYGFGLIHMIGGLSKAATGALRQLLDAGTLANLPAGFKSRGLRVRDDAEPLQPGEFRDIDAPGGNIRDQFQLLPFKEPSQTLFSLLGFCVDAGRRFAAIADLQVGDGNQQAAVGTTVALLERGSRVMSAIHKRAYYSMKEEFRIMSRIFSEYLPPEYPYNVVGGNRLIKMSDFDDRVDVVPVADPNIFSMSQRVTLAQTELQLAQANPQIHNMHEAYRRMYEALGVRNIDGLLQPEPDPPVPIDPAQENTAALQMQLPKAFAEQNHNAHIAAHMSFIRTRMVQSNPSVYALLQGHVSEHVSLKAKKEIMEAFMQQPNLVQLQQVNPEEFAKQFESAVAERIVVLTDELVNQEMQFLGQMNQDPLVMLKQRELDLKAQDIARKAQETAERLNVETNKFESQQTIAEDKLNLQEEVQRGRLKILQDKAREEKN